MNLERYNYFTSDYQTYEFFIDGPKGHIRKLVTFTKMPDTKPLIYNLAFGDAHPVTDKLDDAIITNNEDTDIVLATVANTIVTFCEYYGSHYIYAEGSSSTRTRLYQMGIALLWDEISTDFEVYGLKDNNWHQFKPYRVNYEAFLVKRKQSIIFDMRTSEKNSDMSTGTKHTTLEKGFGPAILNNEVKSHSDDPFVIKKADKAKETLKKVGLPDLKKK